MGECNPLKSCHNCEYNKIIFKLLYSSTISEVSKCTNYSPRRLRVPRVTLVSTVIRVGDSNWLAVGRHSIHTRWGWLGAVVNTLRVILLVAICPEQ